MPPSTISRPFLFSLFLLILSLMVHKTESDAPNFLYSSCPNVTTFATKSLYHSNRNLLLSSLASNATQPSGFYSTTMGSGGSGGNTVHGMLMCRGDDTSDTCQTCVGTAVNYTLENCPMAKVGIVFYDVCMIRYSNESFFGKLDVSFTVELENVQNMTGNLTQFIQIVGNTMQEIASKAASGGSSKKFATQQDNFNNLQTVYGLGQCTPDLSEGDCNSCLQQCIRYLPSGREGARVLFPSCNIRYEIYSFYQTIAPTSPAPTPPLPPTNASTTSATATGGQKSSSGKVIAAIVAPAVTAILVLAIALSIRLRKPKTKNLEAKNVDKTSSEDFTTVESLLYDFSTLQAATNNFSDDSKIGEGGFGAVYKGRLTNGQEIAVKRLSASSSQGVEQFKNEVVLVAKLQHRNLVRLLGFCLEGEEKLLVYEFVPNKSLDYFLFDPEKQALLDWSRCYKIIFGIARGMLYLHEDSPLRIIHRDLKASNVLVDDDMNPKISDFGMAKILGVDQTQTNTTRVVGTFGYMSPEYVMQGHISTKSDVYSFGILVLEIICGQRNTNFYQSGYSDLLSYAWKLWSEGMPLKFIDPTMENSYLSHEVIRCIHLGLLCVDDEANKRPTMASIVLMLDSPSTIMRMPRRPTFLLRSGTDPSLTSSDQSMNKSMPRSANDVSITELDPR